MTDQLPRLLYTEEVEQQVGIPRETLKTWRRRGVGPNWQKVGHRIGYPAAELKEWLDAGASIGRSA